MKILKMAIIALFASTVFVACNKDSDAVTPPFEITGTWEGQTGNGGYFGIKIKSGGQLQRIASSGTISATGTWQLNGNSLTGSYSFIATGTVVNFNATVDKAQNKFTGTWSNNGGEQGTMYANKKN